MLDYPFTREDAQAAHEAWGCNCGPAALAFALQISLDAVRPLIPEFEAKRYASPTMMKAALAKAGRDFESISHFEKMDKAFDARPALTRIQWTGPWTAEGANPRWAYRHTHWICTWQGKNRANLIFDINCGVNHFDEWEAEVVPLILKECVPRADGGWKPTHIWRLT